METACIILCPFSWTISVSLINYSRGFPDLLKNESRPKWTHAFSYTEAYYYLLGASLFEIFIAKKRHVCQEIIFQIVNDKSPVNEPADELRKWKESRSFRRPTSSPLPIRHCGFWRFWYKILGNGHEQNKMAIYQLKLNYSIKLTIKRCLKLTQNMRNKAFGRRPTLSTE